MLSAVKANVLVNFVWIHGHITISGMRGGGDLGGSPGGRLGLNHVRIYVCPKVKEMGSFSASSE